MCSLDSEQLHRRRQAYKYSVTSRTSRITFAALRQNTCRLPAFCFAHADSLFATYRLSLQVSVDDVKARKGQKAATRMVSEDDGAADRTGSNVGAYITGARCSSSESWWSRWVIIRVDQAEANVAPQECLPVFLTPRNRPH